MDALDQLYLPVESIKRRLGAALGKGLSATARALRLARQSAPPQ